MSEPRRVMVDIETLGLERGAAIVSIGAVRFNTNGINGSFERSVSLSSCQDAGLTIDAETIEWWFSQDDAPREQIAGGVELVDALSAFTAWYGDVDEIWANSPSFDCELLEAAYEAVGLEEPWDFWEERDVRTIASLPVAPDIEQEGTEHDAIDDARHQAHVVGKALRKVDATQEVKE